MKRKKSMFFVWAVIALLCAGGAIYLGARLLLLRRAFAIKAQGMAAIKAGDDAQAADLLLQYIHRRPRDIEAIKTYIQVRQRVPMTSAQQYAETIGILKLLLQQDPNQLDNQRYLLELYVKLERGPEATDIADAILAKLPNDVITLQLKTQVFIQERKFEDALQMSERWAGAAPVDLQAQLTRLDLYFQQGRPAPTIIANAQMLRESHPGDARFEVLQGFTYARAKDEANAMLWLQTAAKHPDLSDEITQTLIEQFDGLGKYSDSLAVLRDRVAHQAGPEVRHLLARRLWELNRWKETAENLTDLSLSDPNVDVTLMAFKAESLAKLGRTSEAAACRKSLDVSKRPEAIAWSALLRRIIDGAAVDDKQLLADCKAAYNLDAANAYIAYFIADCEMRLGELDLAAADFGRAASLDIHWDLPAVRLSDCLLEKGDTVPAYEVARSVASRNLTDPVAALAVARAWAACIENGEIGHPENLLALLARIQKQIPGENRTTPVLKVQVLAVQGNNDEAIQAARAAINQTPAPPEQVFQQIAAISERHKLGIEGECFAAWQRAIGITSGLAYAEAVRQSLDGHAQDGLILFDSFAKQSGKSNEIDWQMSRANYLDVTGDAGAKAAWTSLRDAFPNTLFVQQACANARVGRGDWQFMQPVIDHLHSLTGDIGLTWRLTEARLMIQSPRNEGDYDKGSIELNSLIAHYPQLAEPHVLLAGALLHMKRTDGAVEQLNIATQLDPASVATALELASLLQSNGQLDKASQELDRITSQPLNVKQRQEVAVILTRQGNADRALQLLQLPADSGNPATQPADDENEDLLLAVIYQQKHDSGKAEALAHKMLAHPNVAVIQFATSLFLADGHPADADLAMRQLDGLSLQPGVKEMIWGNYCFRQLHDTPSALRYFTAAAQQSPANIGAWQAKMVCFLTQGEVTATMATLDQAIAALPRNAGLSKLNQHAQLLRTAASDDRLRQVVMSIIENPVDSATALDFLNIATDENLASAPDQRAARLTQFAQDHADYLQAQLSLTQCYLDMHRTSDAISTIQRAMAAFPNSSDAARVDVIVCAAAGHWQDMETAAQNWKSHDPAVAEEADVTMADAECQLRDFTSALSTLQPYLDKAKADPDHHVDLLTKYAEACIGDGNATAASDVLWPLAVKSPMWRYRWLEVATELPDVSQATAWLDRASGIIPANEMGSRIAMAEAFDHLGRRNISAPDAALIQRSLDLFNELIKDPNANAVVFEAAGAESERSGQFTDAETRYRRTVALDSSQWMAFNNLAMLHVTHGGDLKEAVQFARTAVKLQPRSAEVNETLAEVQAKAGDPKSAAATMRICVQLQPDEIQWRIQLAQYLLAGGQPAEASNVVTAIDTAFPDLRSQPAAIQQEVADIRAQIHGKGV